VLIPRVAMGARSCYCTLLAVGQWMHGRAIAQPVVVVGPGFTLGRGGLASPRLSGLPSLCIFIHLVQVALVVVWRLSCIGVLLRANAWPLWLYWSDGFLGTFDMW